MSLADLYYEVKQLVKAQPSIAPLEVQQSLVGDFPEIENKGSLVWKAMVKCYRKHPDVVDESVIATIVDFLLYLFHRHYDEVTDEQMSAFVMHVLGGTVNPDFVEASVRDVLGNLVDQRLSMPDAASNNYDELATAGFLPHEPPVEMPLIPRVRLTIAARRSRSAGVGRVVARVARRAKSRSTSRGSRSRSTSRRSACSCGCQVGDCQCPPGCPCGCNHLSRSRRIRSRSIRSRSIRSPRSRGGRR